ncbi:carbohydrate ABC transporter permease [Butyrivibrio sp. FCS014]|uniref:carbohydrate ABC transporter permease n=1 Tax=Butyrivibrio sp. FCS014 TaxID=1408304 RepID=UPI0004B960E1|nr:carbohydrate ABC transporter permease [Butyrivibrio sp. FCS014]
MRAERNRKSITFAITLVVLILFMVPFYMLVVNSFKPTAEFLKNPFALPQSFNVDNFITAIDRMNFGKSLFNTAAITVTAVVVNMIVSAMTGYLFARRKWKIKQDHIHGISGIHGGSFSGIYDTPCKDICRSSGFFPTI